MAGFLPAAVTEIKTTKALRANTKNTKKPAGTESGCSLSRLG